jgi:hypothetical protein
MELVTNEITLDKFSSKDDWLIEDPNMEAIYRMRMALLSGRDYYLYVIQTGDSQCPVYVRTAGGGAVIIASKSSVLAALQTKQFSID